MITGQVTAPVVVRLPQDRPAFLQSRYEDGPINALAGLSPKIVRLALSREWLSLHARAHPHVLDMADLPPPLDPQSLPFEKA